MDVRAGHARMQHVADDGHAQIGEVFFEMPDGVGVQQTLRGVRVSAVTGVDDMHMWRDMLGDQIRRTGFAVAHHKNISGHGAQVGDGVEQAFAFAGG